MADLPYGMSVYAAGEIGAVPNRSYYVVENEAEIHAMYDDDLSTDAKGRSQVTCGYCSQTTYTTRHAALRWFQNHECRVDPALADRNQFIVQMTQAWDMGIGLPADHPFAPSVDGRRAA